MTASRNTGNPTGRPAFVPTDEQRRIVSTCIGLGLKQSEIALLIADPRTKQPITDRTLRTKFSGELASGKVKLIAALGQSLMRKAMGTGTGAVAANIFALKVLAGWRDVNRTEVTGADGGPINVISDADLAKLTDAELETAKNLITKLQASARATVDEGGDE